MKSVTIRAAVALNEAGWYVVRGSDEADDEINAVEAGGHMDWGSYPPQITPFRVPRDELEPIAGPGGCGTFANWIAGSVTSGIIGGLPA